MSKKKYWSPGLDVRNIEITSPKFDSDNLLDLYPQFQFVDYSHRNNPIQQVQLPQNVINQLPQKKAAIDWNARARERFGANASMDSVRALQQKMQQAGVNIGIHGADGKWGSDSEKAYEEYLEKLRMQREQEVRSENTDSVIIQRQNNTPNTSSTLQTPASNQAKTNNENWFRTTANVFKNSKGFGQNLYNMFNTMADWRDDGWLTKTQKNHIYLQPGRTTSHRVGGKFQQGGTMQNEQELQKAFMAFLIEDAAAQGMQIQSEQDLQAYAQQLGEEGLKAKYQEFMQKMQGGVKARLGAKLDYINKLKGNCPDGSEPYYFKEGGSMKKGCKPCMQKAQSGAKTKKVNEVQKFKSRNVKVSEFKGKANEADTVHVNKNIYSLTNSDGSRVDKRFPAYSTEQYKKDAKTKDGKNRRFKQDLVSSEKCGGKAKKNK